MINRRPHLLTYYTIGEGYEDSNGDYHEGEAQSGSYPCQAVPSGAANTISFEDGIVQTYTYLVILPKNCRKFVVGEKVKLQLEGGTTSEHKVKGFHRYQMQSKLWL